MPGMSWSASRPTCFQRSARARSPRSKRPNFLTCCGGWKPAALDIAKRLRQTVGQVFRFAVVTGRARRDPAADLKGALTRPANSTTRRCREKNSPGFCEPCRLMTESHEPD